MNPLLRLVIPVLLGVGAAVLNGIVINSRTASHPFVSVRQGVKAGEIIEASVLERTDLPGDPGKRKASLVAYGDRDVVVGTRAQRHLFPGDLLFWQDVTRPDEAIPAEADERILPIDLSGVSVETSLLFPGGIVDFWVAPPRAGTSASPRDELVALSDGGGEKGSYQFLGPFRILSVGARFSQPAPGEATTSRGTQGNERVVSVAVKVAPNGDYDRDSRQLLDAHAQKRIMAIVLHPRSNDSDQAPAELLSTIKEDDLQAGQPRSEAER